MALHATQWHRATTRGCLQSQLLFVNSQRYPLQVLVGETFAYDSISLSMQQLHAICVYIYVAIIKVRSIVITLLKKKRIEWLQKLEVEQKMLKRA